MKEYKIQIFEDDWATIKGSFELANIFAFDNKLKFIVRAKSQDASFTSGERNSTPYLLILP